MEPIIDLTEDVQDNTPRSLPTTVRPLQSEAAQVGQELAKALATMQPKQALRLPQYNSTDTTME